MEMQHVRVQANVVDINTGREETTNDFRFTFAKDDRRDEMPRIVPRTYQGMNAFIQSGRYRDILVVSQTRRSDAVVGRQEGTRDG